MQYLVTVNPGFGSEDEYIQLAVAKPGACGCNGTQSPFSASAACGACAPRNSLLDPCGCGIQQQGRQEAGHQLHSSAACKTRQPRLRRREHPLSASSWHFSIHLSHGTTATYFDGITLLTHRQGSICGYESSLPQPFRIEPLEVFFVWPLTRDVWSLGAVTMVIKVYTSRACGNPRVSMIKNACLSSNTFNSYNCTAVWHGPIELAWQFANFAIFHSIY